MFIKKLCNTLIMVYDNLVFLTVSIIAFIIVYLLAHELDNWNGKK